MGPGVWLSMFPIRYLFGWVHSQTRQELLQTLESRELHRMKFTDVHTISHHVVHSFSDVGNLSRGITGRVESLPPG